MTVCHQVYGQSSLTSIVPKTSSHVHDKLLSCEELAGAINEGGVYGGVKQDVKLQFNKIAVPRSEEVVRDPLVSRGGTRCLLGVSVVEEPELLWYTTVS